MNGEISSLCDKGMHKYKKIWCYIEHSSLTVSLSKKVLKDVCEKCGMYQSVEKYQSLKRVV
jgi:hypothetical protein